MFRHLGSAIFMSYHLCWDITFPIVPPDSFLVPRATPFKKIIESPQLGVQINQCNPANHVVQHDILVVKLMGKWKW